MIQKLLNERVRRFIQENEQTDPFSLSLKYKEVEGVDISLIIDQVKGKSVAKKKIPSWYANDQIVYPPKLSMEQCSSEETALYKSNLVTGASLIDLTGGAGVDVSFFSKTFKQVSHIERNRELSHCALHNFQVLGLNNIVCYNQQSESFLQSLTKQVDCIYIDPARRADTGKKVFRFEDCEPNVIELIPLLLTKSKQVMIKASPMLDIALAIKQLGYVSNIHVVSVDNECKELLLILKKDANQTKITTINLQRSRLDQRMEFDYSEENNAVTPTYSSPLKYLYEPNASVLKSGAFKITARYFDLFKLHANTHLYTSATLVENFPGRVFEVTQVAKFSKKEVAKFLPDRQANLAVRNFPVDVHQVKKKLGIKDGGEIYLFACTGAKGEKIIIITKKL